MHLSYSPSSPYVRKVMVVLHETGQENDITTSRPALNPFEFDADFVAVNPLAKVPALTLADGHVIYDSRVICGYLNERAGGDLYGAGPAHWDIRTLEATADGIIDAAFSMAVEVRFRPEEIRSAQWMDGQWMRILNTCAALNTRWITHLTDGFDIGHVAVGCALGYLDFRHDARNWRSAHPALAEWYADFSARPSMLATAPQ